jgi:AcrR family transcriptional regulator
VRDPRRDRDRRPEARFQRILTRDLLTERGFDATTMQAVAERACVHASALYRRWPSRIEMITEATFPGLDPGSVAPTGDLRRDLRRFIRAYTAAFTAPAARAAAGGLLAHIQSSPAPRPPELNLRVSARPQFRAILAAAPPGAVDPVLDPDDVFDLLLGAILVRILLPAATARRHRAERVVDMVMRVLRAGSADGAGPGERPLS